MRSALAGEAVSFEAQFKTLQGETVYWQVNFIPDIDEQQRVLGFFNITHDLTPGKRAEAKLRENEARTQLLLEAANVGLWDWNPTTGGLYFSAEWKRQIGYADHELPDRFEEWEERLHPSDRARILAAVSDFIEGRRSEYSEEFRFRHRDGSYRWILTQANLIYTAQGKTERMMGGNIDITARKLAESRLRESEEKFRALFDNASDAIFLTEGDQVIDCNARTLEMFGCSRDEIVGHLPYRLSPVFQPNGRKSYELASEQVADTLAGRPQFFEWMHQRLDGTLFPVEVSLSAVKLGERLLLQAIVRDITARKLTEDKLRESDLSLRAVSQGVILTGPDQNIRWVNEAFTTITGYQLNEVIGRNSRLLQGPLTDPKVVQEIRQALERAEAFSGEILNYRKDGTPHWNDLSISPGRDEQGRLSCFVGIMRDVTERKQAHQEREQLDRKMQEAQKLESLGVLAGGIAHDFNNLLTSILGNTNLLDVELPPGSPLREYTAQIAQTSQRAAGLCQQMLAYSGRGRFVVERLELSRLVVETTQLLQLSISKKVTLSLQLEEGLPAMEADTSQLHQVLMNMVINASEAIGDQGGVITIFTGLTTVESSYFKDALGAPDLPAGEYLFLEVADDGCGMSAETQRKIFDPFFTTKFTGRGLGLAAVLGIVRGHKGALTVRSVLGKGTSFRLLFPLASRLKEAEAKQSIDHTANEQGTILVVDDDESLRRTITRILRHFSFTSVVASDGREAMALFGADPGRFALVLLDLTMPNMDGLETFTALQQVSPGVRVVLMSGYNQQESMGRFSGNKPVGFLQKPFSLSALQQMIQRVLG